MFGKAMLEVALLDLRNRSRWIRSSAIAWFKAGHYKDFCRIADVDSRLVWERFEEIIGGECG